MKYGNNYGDNNYGDNNYGDNNYVQQQQPACIISPSSVLVFGILSMVFSGLHK